MLTRSLARRALLAPVLAVAVLVVAPNTAPAEEDRWGREVPAYRGDHETREAWRDERRDRRRDWRRDFVEDRDDFFERREEFFDRREAWRDRRHRLRDDRFDRHAYGRNFGRFDRHRFGRRHDDRFGDGFPPRRYFPPRRHGFGGAPHFDRHAFGRHEHRRRDRDGFRWSR